MIVLTKGDDVIAWVNWPGNMPSSGDEIPMAMDDITYRGNHSLKDLNGPGLVLDFRDPKGTSLLKLQGTPSRMDLQNKIV
jgi:hypothetical protein